MFLQCRFIGVWLKQHKLVQFRRLHFFFTKMVVPRELWMQLESTIWNNSSFRASFNDVLSYSVYLLFFDRQFFQPLTKIPEILDNFKLFQFHSYHVIFFSLVLVITGVFDLIDMTYFGIGAPSTDSFEKQRWSNLGESPILATFPYIEYTNRLARIFTLFDSCHFTDTRWKTASIK